MLGLALYTFRESLRDRIYLGFLAGMAVVVGVFVIAGSTPWGFENLVVARLGWSAVEILLSVLVAIYAVANIVRERERRLLYMHLTLPLGRVKYLGGKALGIWLATLLLSLLGVIILLLGTRYLTHVLRFEWQLLWLVPSVMLKAAVLIGYALLFVQLATSSLSATLFTLGVYLIGNGANELLILAGSAGDGVRSFIEFMYYLVPNLQLIDLERSVLYAQGVKPAQIAQSAVYGMSYFFIAFVLACVLFRRKDL